METNLKRKIPLFCVSNLGFQRWSCSSLENFLCRGAPNTTTRKNASEEEEEKKNGAIAFKLSSISSPRAVLSRRRGGWTFASGRKRPGELLRAFFSSFLDRENERFWGRENRAVARRDAPRRDGFCDHRYLRRGDVFRGERARVARGTRSRLVFFFCLSFACSLEGSLSLFFT